MISVQNLKLQTQVIFLMLISTHFHDFSFLMLIYWVSLITCYLTIDIVSEFSVWHPSLNMFIQLIAFQIFCYVQT